MKLYVFVEGGDGQIGRLRVANEAGERLRGVRGGFIQTRLNEASLVHLDLVVNTVDVVLGEPPAEPAPRAERAALELLVEAGVALQNAHDTGDTDLGEAYAEFCAAVNRGRGILLNT